MSEKARLLTGLSGQRGSEFSPDALPLLLRTATCGSISRGRFNPSWSKRFVMAKWVITGEAAMRVSGRQMPIRPGDVALYTPTIPHEFFAIAPVSEMCWFTADGPQCEPFVHNLGLRPGVYRFGNPPIDTIKNMIAALRDDSLAGRLRASLMGIRLLYDLRENIPIPGPTTIVQRIRHLIQEGLSEPALSASGIADELGYNRSALSQMFRRQTGMTIMACITQTRLQEAEMLLSGTKERVRDVALKCGFRDVSYFSRWVKKHTGQMPRNLRSVE